MVESRNDIFSLSLSGTVVREGEMMRKVSEAFDLLEEDLWRSDQPGGEGGEGRGRRRELVRMSLPVTFSERCIQFFSCKIFFPFLIFVLFLTQVQGFTQSSA